MAKYARARTACIGVVSALVLCASHDAFAQLNQNCTVSVLNRTVQVNPDGSWVLPNIPANFGPVRARATCLINGQTISGESDLFSVPANGVVNLPPIIIFGTTTPIPTAVAVTAPTNVITQAGATLQLSVTGSYADGTTKNVTAGSNGTKYTISNPAMAVITGDGLVQGITSGTVIVQATLEGTSGLFAIQLTLTSIDTDGDGIPDAWEVAHGLNPNNPIDAFEDPDRDDLTNLQEFQHGTDPHKADTDGDGIPDGLEVAEGTNPLDSGSYDLSQALASISVAPASFILTVSPLLLQATQQLIVTGTLNDLKGTQVDLTSGKGTMYTSSNLTVCNFGATEGRVFAGNSGSCVITVSQGPLSATVPGTVQLFTPSEVSRLSVAGAVAVDVGGPFAYVGVGANGLVVVDVNNRTTPKTRGTLSGIGNARAVRVAGQHVFIADSTGFLRVAQVVNPDAPTLVASLQIAGQPTAIAVHANLAAVAAQSGGVSLVDVTDPAAPRLVAAFSMAADALGVDFDQQRGLAAVAMGSAGLQLVDISNASAPQLRGHLAGGDVRRVLLKPPAALLADVQRSVTSVSITNPDQPLVSSSITPNLGGAPVDVASFGPLAITADISFGAVVPIINVTNPLQPNTVAFWTLQGPAFSSSVAMDVNFGYLITPNTLRIFQYQNITDTAGIPPVVTITSPVNGTIVVEGETITATALATDDVAVASVNFFVNGVLLSSQTTAPYRLTFTAPAGFQGFDLRATAVDLGGNSSSAEIRLNVIPDPLTTVSGRVIDPNGVPVAGASVTCMTRSGTSLADGSFLIFGVPTTQPSFTCSARFTPAQGTPLSGTSSSVAPVRAGTTQIGDLLVGPVPIVLAITPKAIDATHPPSSIQIIGANLAGSTFAVVPVVNPPAITFGTPQVNGAGTSATLPILVAPIAQGSFVLVGTNGFGSGATDPTAGNRLSIINTQDDGDSDGDGFPDGLELLFGSDPADPTSLPDLTMQGELLIGAVSVINTASPVVTHDLLSAAFSVSNTLISSPTTHDVLSPAFSVSNTLVAPTMQEMIGPAVSILNVDPQAPLSQQITFSLPQSRVTNPLMAEARALSVFLDTPRDGQSLVEGQTITVSASVSGDQGTGVVAFTVNGATFATDSVPPYAMTFTVPSGVSSLTFGASARDAAGGTTAATPSTVSVEQDPFTTVEGRVVDAAGNAIKGAVVGLLSEGLEAEFFDSAMALNSLPDLTGATATRTTRLTAINMRSPNGIFGSDPFGLGFGPDYAARLTGWITISAPGVYTFFLGADEGARLQLDGATVVDMPTAAGGYQERPATVNLGAGLIPVEITFYESAGNAQLQLSFIPPGGERQVVPPSSLVPNPWPFAVVTDDAGRFTFRGVPTALEGVQVRATVTINGQSTSATSVRVSPVSKEGLDVGNIVVTISR